MVGKVGVLLAALVLHWEKNLLGIMVRREENWVLRKLPCWPAEDLACLLTLLKVEQLAAHLLHPCKWIQPGLWCLGIAKARTRSFW